MGRLIYKKLSVGAEKPTRKARSFDQRLRKESQMHYGKYHQGEF